MYIGNVIVDAAVEVFPATCSYGVARFPLFEDSIELTETADNALYKVRRSGRNRIIQSGK